MKITLCGSAKFEPLWHEINKQLGLRGHICYSLMTFPSVESGKSWYTPEQKQTLDLAHLAKIEESDAVVMINANDYFGESSLRELEWARMRDKKIYFLEGSKYMEGYRDKELQDLLNVSYSAATNMFSPFYPEKE